ncbi:MAG: HNH endonuclease signature motif containing protein [Steroidobacteraceae bacterium]
MDGISSLAEKVRVAHALAGLPKIAASVGRGELSYSKVRALTRVACPATEEALLMIAVRHGLDYGRPLPGHRARRCRDFAPAHRRALRKTRSIPSSIRRALNSRDGGCSFPGCTHQRYVDAHHIEHWAEGGETKLANLVTLCRLHHRPAPPPRAGAASAWTTTSACGC